ncbi:MAG: QcrA and Rieske domain-containing protein [Nitrososphaerales archaeon]
MSADSEDAQKKKAQQTSAPEQKSPVESSGQTEQPKPVTPMVGTPRPTSTPIGTASSASASRASTPVVGTAKPAVGTPVSRPIGSPSASPSAPGKPTPPQKPPEPKGELSRRNFIKALAVIGGLTVAFGALYPFLGLTPVQNEKTKEGLLPYLQSSVGAGTATPKQQIINLNTGAPLKPSDVTAGGQIVFHYPSTGNPNIDADSFVQCVLLQLPSGLTSDYSVSENPSDSSAPRYVAFSRVCVHLWCLWSYAPTDPRGPVMVCPCHGSTYVPGTGQYPKFTPASDQLPGTAVAGPASLQSPPNDTLPLIELSIENGTFYATGRIGQVGYCGISCK